MFVSLLREEDHVDNRLRVEILYDSSIEIWAHGEKKVGTIIAFIPQTGGFRSRRGDAIAIIKLDNSSFLEQKFLHEIKIIERDDYIGDD